MIFLPRISALHCMVLILMSNIAAIYRLIKVQPNALCRSFLRALVYAAMCSFMLGYHVHEKAIIIPWILQTFLVAETEMDRLLYFLLTLSGLYSLFPLIPGKFEWCIKNLLTILFLSITYFGLDIKQEFSIQSKRLVFIFSLLLPLYYSII
jgi:alpha-1,3-glucosyltransferase